MIELASVQPREDDRVVELLLAGVPEAHRLYAGRVIRHKGQPDEEERQARYTAPVDPVLFERVQELRAERSTRHPGATIRRSYPTVRLMRCTSCDSTYFGDANNGLRCIRHGLRPACGPSASYRAERYEEQVAGLMDTIDLSRVSTAAVSSILQPSGDPSEPGPG